MRLRSHTFRAAAVVAASALVLAACGGSDSESGAGSEESSSAEPSEESDAGGGGGGKGDGTLVVGTLLPQTGDLAFLGPPEFAGVDLAVKEINEAGGVNGSPVKQVKADSGDGTPNIAPQETNNLLDAGADVVVGAASSSVSLSVIDKITGAGVVHFSPANTSTAFDTYDDKGLYFRTAPPDVLQAQALAALMGSDGAQRISLLARNDPYGTGLANNTEQNLLDAGIPQDQLQKIVYDPNAASFNAEVDMIREFNPDAIAVIGFDESKKILSRMSELQIGPGEKLVYGTDGNMGNALGVGFPPGLLDGMKGTLPLTELSGDFRQRLLAVDPALIDFNYSAEAYDAVMLLALAAEQVDSTKGVDIASAINSVTQEGEKCSDFAACKVILDTGGDVDYDGVTGTLDFTAAGEPGSGSYGIQTFNAQNQIDDAATRYVTVGR